MSIVRVEHNSQNPFVMINKNSLWDDELSLEAVGLWSRLLSKPDDWQISVTNLSKSCKCPVKRIYRLLNELIKTGYAVRVQTNGKEKKGFSKVSYVIYEFKKISTLSQKRLSAEPLSAKRDTTNTEYTKTDRTNPPPPSSELDCGSPQSDPPTKEEEEELRKRLRERPKNFPKIKNLKRWREKVLEEIRRESEEEKAGLRAIEEVQARIKRHREEAERNASPGRIIPSSIHVVLQNKSGSLPVPYALPDEEWVPLMARWFKKK